MKENYMSKLTHVINREKAGVGVTYSSGVIRPQCANRMLALLKV